jgi:spore maturation protein CgeB
MHIGVIGPATPDSFGDNIGNSLEAMGHVVSRLGGIRPDFRGPRITRTVEIVHQAYPRLEGRTHLKVAAKALALGCRIVLSTDAALAPEAVELLRRNRVVVALWFPDAVVNLGRLRMLTAPYNALFFKDRILVERIKETLGLPVHYLPQACNPRWHRPIGEAGSKHHVAVVGNTYVTRLLLLERLHRDGIPIVIYGSPFPRWAARSIPDSCHTGRVVRREEKSRVFREAAAVLNNMHPAEMDSVNLRLFEATAAGAAVLCERRPALKELYDEHEIVAFSSYDELLERTRELLGDQRMTRRIGDLGNARAYRDHTYQARLDRALELLT